MSIKVAEVVDLVKKIATGEVNLQQTEKVAEEEIVESIPESETGKSLRKIASLLRKEASEKDSTKELEKTCSLLLANDEDTVKLAFDESELIKPKIAKFSKDSLMSEKLRKIAAYIRELDRVEKIKLARQAREILETQASLEVFKRT